MKKLLAFLMAVTFLLSLAACDRASADSQTTGPTETPPETTVPESPMSDTAKALGITAENYPRIDGSTSTLDIVRNIWYNMHKEGTEEYDAGDSLEASRTVPSYHLLIDGEVDMILVTYASQDVLQAAADAGVELEFHKVAAEALIFITAANNTAENITREQVRSIYLDYGIRSWTKLGGPDRELVPICRNSDSGSQSQMDNLILENEPMHPDIQNNYVELTMDGMLQQVAFYHNGGKDFANPDHPNTYALGYTLYSYLQAENKYSGVGDSLRILNYEGFTPSPENIADGTYPLSDGYYAVVRTDLPEDHTARAVIRWLQSDEGVRQIESLGMISCKAE